MPREHNKAYLSIWIRLVTQGLLLGSRGVCGLERAQGVVDAAARRRRLALGSAASLVGVARGGSIERGWRLLVGPMGRGDIPGGWGERAAWGLLLVLALLAEEKGHGVGGCCESGVAMAARGLSRRHSGEVAVGEGTSEASRGRDGRETDACLCAGDGGVVMQTQTEEQM